jgi:hypothetical protein
VAASAENVEPVELGELGPAELELVLMMHLEVVPAAAPLAAAAGTLERSLPQPAPRSASAPAVRRAAALARLGELEAGRH